MFDILGQQRWARGGPNAFVRNVSARFWSKMLVYAMFLVISWCKRCGLPIYDGIKKAFKSVYFKWFWAFLGGSIRGGWRLAVKLKSVPMQRGVRSFFREGVPMQRGTRFLIFEVHLRGPTCDFGRRPKRYKTNDFFTFLKQKGGQRMAHE